MSDLSLVNSAPQILLPRAARVRQVIQETARVKTIVLDERLQATPGQFVMLWLPGVGEKPFSLACDNPLTLVVAKVGPFSAALHQLHAGDWLWWRGPLGHGFALPTSNPRETMAKRLLLVAGGYGVAPLGFLAQRARAGGWPITFALGARSVGELVLRERILDLGCGLDVYTEDGSAGIRGLVTDAVERALLQTEPIEHACVVYGCGPLPMLDALRAACRRLALPCQLSLEATMKCALGVCGSCTYEGWLVCKDGPVFSWSAAGQLYAAT